MRITMFLVNKNSDVVVFLREHFGSNFFMKIIAIIILLVIVAIFCIGASALISIIAELIGCCVGGGDNCFSFNGGDFAAIAIKVIGLIAIGVAAVVGATSVADATFGEHWAILTFILTFIIAIASMYATVNFATDSFYS